MSLAAAIERYNQRVGPLDRLWARTVVQVTYTDDDGRRRVEQFEGHFQYRHPDHALLTFEKVGKMYAALGADEHRYWWIERNGTGRAYVGHHEQVTPRRIAELGVPVHPLTLIDLAGITPVSLPAGVDGGGGDVVAEADGTVSFPAMGRTGPLRLRVDPRAWAPLRIEALDQTGQVRLAADLTDYQGVILRGERSDAWRPTVAREIRIRLEAHQAAARLMLYEPETGGGRPRPEAFRFERLKEALGVVEEVSLDELSMPAGGRSGPEAESVSSQGNRADPQEDAADGHQPGSGALGSALVNRWDVLARGMMMAGVASTGLVGEVLPGTGTPLGTRVPSEGHAWACVRARATGQAVALLHLPARGVGVPDGSVRIAARLAAAPTVVAAWDRRVYLAFPTPRGDGTAEGATGVEPRAGRWRITALDIEPGLLPGSWGVVTPGARLPTLGAVEGDTLIAMAGTPCGPAVLIERRGERQLDVLAGGEWRRIPLPQTAADRSLRLVSREDGVEIVACDLTEAWAGQWTSRPDSLENVRWTHRSLRPRSDDGDRAPPPDTAPAAFGSALVYAARSGDRTVDIWRVDEHGARRIASVAGVAGEWAAVPLTTMGRMAVVWSEPADNRRPGPTTSPPMHVRIVELAVDSGATFYAGPARIGGPVSSQELRLLAVALVVVAGAIVLFVLRPEPDQPPFSLPPHVALAGPLRRMTASAMDAAAAMYLGAWAAGMPPGDWLSLERWLTDPTPLGALMSGVGIGAGIGTVCEWIVGQTPGKALCLCAVVRSVVKRGEDGQVRVEVCRPTFLGALTRNLVKWVLPPVAVAGMLSGERRHRGDILARTAVVVRV